MNHNNIDINNFVAAFVLHALGDTLGFKNGEWEFNYFIKNANVTLNMTNEFLYDFISLGGINGINLDGWLVSDDTIFNIAVTKGLLNSGFNNNKKLTDKNINKVKEELVDATLRMQDDKDADKNRFMGMTTLKYIAIIDETPEKDARDYPYDKKAGGNGAAMRSGILGLVYFGNNNHKRELLIESSIILSKLTHNNAFGYLAGLVNSLFVAFAIEKIPVKNWVFKMMEILSSESVTKYINNKDDDEHNDYEKFMNYWKKYTDTRFDSNKEPLFPRSHKNLIFRTKYYYENFTVDSDSELMGQSGFCAMIMAYDALLDCDGYWEKLVIYACLHLGDSDTVGAIAGFLYGAVYGFGDVPENNLKYLEYKDELIKLAEELYHNIEKNIHNPERIKNKNKNKNKKI